MIKAAFSAEAERLALVREIAAWYAEPENAGAGGCLHVQLDDDNLEDEYLNCVGSSPYDESTPDRRKELHAWASRILQRLRVMDLAQRVLVVGAATRVIAQGTPEEWKNE